jgi:hypothetical protein
MKDIESRIKKLENHTSANEPDDITLVIVTGDIRAEAGAIDWDAIKKHKEAAHAKVEAAIAEYRAKHPEDAKRKISTISVINEHTKELVEALNRGEGGGRLSLSLGMSPSERGYSQTQESAN